MATVEKKTLWMKRERFAGDALIIYGLLEVLHVSGDGTQPLAGDALEPTTIPSDPH